jgi:hypothetical protein
MNISADSQGFTNCAAPTPMQQAGVGSCSEWHAAGALGGYITMVDADTVEVQLLNESLCVLLAGTAPALSMVGTNGYRQCTAAGLKAGDYCSTTHKAGGCNDSVWLSANFAASAVKIATGKGVDEYMSSDLCNGGSL